MKSNGNNNQFTATSQHSQQGMANAQKGGLFSWLGWLGRKLEAIIKGVAYTLRAVLRQNIGSKTFTFWTLLYGYIWTRVLLVWDFEFSAWSEYPLFDQYPENAAAWLDLIWLYIRELFENLKRIYRISTTPAPNPLRSFMLLAYSYVFVTAAILHKLSNDRKFRKKIPRDRNNRGDSFFFAWLEGKPLPFMGRKIQDHHIKIFIEPLSVLVFGWLFFRYGDQQFGLFLMIGACCLALEEFRGYLEWRNYLESVDDQEFYFKRLGRERAKFS